MAASAVPYHWYLVVGMPGPRAARPWAAATRARVTRQLASATGDASLNVLLIRRRRECTPLT